MKTYEPKMRAIGMIIIVVELHQINLMIVKNENTIRTVIDGL